MTCITLLRRSVAVVGLSLTTPFSTSSMGFKRLADVPSSPGSKPCESRGPDSADWQLRHNHEGLDKVTSANNKEAVNPIVTFPLPSIDPARAGSATNTSRRRSASSGACSSLIAETGQVDPPCHRNPRSERVSQPARFYRLFNSKEVVHRPARSKMAPPRKPAMSSNKCHRPEHTARTCRRMGSGRLSSLYTQDPLQGYRAILLHTYRWETVFPTELRSDARATPAATRSRAPPISAARTTPITRASRGRDHLRSLVLRRRLPRRGTEATRRSQRRRWAHRDGRTRRHLFSAATAPDATDPSG